MAWNEPGDKNNGNKDPWSGGNKSQTPPDLDEVFRKLQKKLSGKFGAGGDGSGGFFASGKHPLFPFAIAAGIILLIWAAFGFFIVGQPEQAAVLRFGKYIETVGPGAHWIPPFIESEYKVNEQKIYVYSYNDRMFTKDENIVAVAIVVQYRVDNAKDFLFNTSEPIQTLKEATASALRQVVGNSTLDFVITTGRDAVRTKVQEKLANILKGYQVGLQVTDVKLQSATAPEEVKDAFDDVTKAREDKQRYINQARAYATKVTFNAEGQAKRLMADANAYKQQAVLKSQGETARYLALLPEYQKAPAVTRERLYLGTLEGVFEHTTKVLVDVQGSNNLMYLPLDKLLQGSNVVSPPGPMLSGGSVTPPLAAGSRQPINVENAITTAADNGYSGLGSREPYGSSSYSTSGQGG